MPPRKTFPWPLIRVGQKTCLSRAAFAVDPAKPTKAHRKPRMVFQEPQTTGQRSKTRLFSPFHIGLKTRAPGFFPRPLRVFSYAVLHLFALFSNPSWIFFKLGAQWVYFAAGRLFLVASAGACGDSRFLPAVVRAAPSIYSEKSK